MTQTADQCEQEIRRLSCPERRKINMSFFKTGPGEYGEGDEFIGVRVPDVRQVIRQFKAMPLSEVQVLLYSPIHEIRLAAVLILTQEVRRKSSTKKKVICDFYLEHIDQVNNWDLVDLSAPWILGPFLDSLAEPLQQLLHSPKLWHRRVAVLATFHEIRCNDFNRALKVITALLEDKEDLIHKATGWMLREIGKRDCTALETFLAQYAPVMSRTALRYAIERMSQARRLHFLSMKA